MDRLLTDITLEALERARRGLCLPDLLPVQRHLLLRPPSLLGVQRFICPHHEEVHLVQLTATRPRHEQSFDWHAARDQVLLAGLGAFSRELVLDR
eukprot:scaffold5885_cov60-Phaeocystis_antarctica.AAC.3